MDISQFTSQDNPLANNQLQSLPTSITNALAPILLLSTIISVLFLVAYIVSSIRRWKVQQAILDIQKEVKELNERDRNRSMPPAQQPITPSPALVDNLSTTVE